MWLTTQIHKFSIETNLEADDIDALLGVELLDPFGVSNLGCLGDCTVVTLGVLGCARVWLDLTGDEDSKSAIIFGFSSIISSSESIIGNRKRNSSKSNLKLKHLVYSQGSTMKKITSSIDQKRLSQLLTDNCIKTKTHDPFSIRFALPTYEKTFASSLWNIRFLPIRFQLAVRIDRLNSPPT